jgi:hypothetical protein
LRAPLCGLRRATGFGAGRFAFAFRAAGFFFRAGFFAFDCTTLALAFTLVLALTLPDTFFFVAAALRLAAFFFAAAIRNSETRPMSGSTLALPRHVTQCAQ